MSNRDSRNRFTREELSSLIATGLLVEEIAELKGVKSGQVRKSAGHYDITIPWNQHIPHHMIEALSLNVMTIADVCSFGYDKGLVRRCLDQSGLEGYDPYWKLSVAGYCRERERQKNPRKWEDGEFVTCPICDEKFTRINQPHLDKHGYSKEEFLIEFPDADLCSSRLRKLYSDTLKQTNKKIWSTPEIAERCLAAISGHENAFGRYSGIRCCYIDRYDREYSLRSRLELAAAVTLDNLDTEWEYEPHWITGQSGKRYRPDFLVDSEYYIEVKPRCFREKAVKQIESVEDALTMPVVIWTQDDIKHALRLVREVDHFETVSFVEIGEL